MRNPVYNQSVYMIRPTEWSDTIIRANASAQCEARVRVHAGLLSFRGEGHAPSCPQKKGDGQ